MPIGDSGEHANMRTIDPTYKSFLDMQAIAKVSNKYRFHILNICKYALNTSYAKDHVLARCVPKEERGPDNRVVLRPKILLPTYPVIYYSALIKSLNVY